MNSIFDIFIFSLPYRIGTFISVVEAIFGAERGTLPR